MCPEPPDDTPNASTTRLSRAAAEQLRQARGAASVLSLVVCHRDGVEVVPLRAGVWVVLGRTAPSDVTIGDASLSRQHARFQLADGEVVVEDLGSTNGTVVSGETVQEARLRPGDEAVLGAVTVAVQTHEAGGGGGAAAGVLGHDRFRALLEDEAGRARFFRRGFAMLTVQAARGREAHVRFWSDRVRAAVRPVDRAGLYSEEILEVLLPEATGDVAAEIARAIASPPELGPSLACGIAVFPDTATSAEELLDECLSALRRATPAQPVQLVAGMGARTLPPREGKAGTLPVQTANPRMRALLETAERVARAAIPVLVVGETGTGKEVLARFLHEAGPRKDRPLVCVNCAAIPTELLESTLFGHEKGAFTGALQLQKGVFESGDGGTVFLDEIGELPAAAQAALLRVLETKRFARVGSNRELEVDVRVVAATHRDLEAMVEQGRFRQDLLFRLNALTLVLPPLRERTEDVPRLATHFLAEASRANGASVRAIDADAMALLGHYGWPGNVRELKNAIERAVVIAHGDTVTIDDLPDRVRGTSWSAAPTPARPAAAASTQAPAPVGDVDFRTAMERLEAEVLVEALRQCGWNQTETARQLQMPLRTLVHKIKVHGIKKPPAP